MVVVELHCKFQMKNLIESKKGGVVSDLVQGTGALIIGVIIVLVIISTLIAADLFSGNRATATVTNQSVSVNDSDLGTIFGNSTLNGAICSIISVTNSTIGSEVIPATNYTIVEASCTIQAVDASIFNNTYWNVTSSTSFYGASQDTVNNLNSNFTGGIDNVSAKIPTILLIAAVVLLFGVLVLLVAQSRRMGIGSGGASL